MTSQLFCNHVYKMVKWLPLCIALYSFSLLHSQESGKIKDKQSKENSLLIQSSFGTNTESFGTFESNVKQPSLTGFISYFTPFHLDFSLMQMAIWNSDDSLSGTTSETDISLGYKLILPRNTYLYGSYMHSFYSANSSIIRAGFTEQLSADIGYEGKYWTPSVTGIVLSGTSTEFILDAVSSLSFELKEFPFRNSDLLLMPTADLMMSKMQFYNDYLLEQFQAHPLKFIYYYRFRKNMTRQQIEDMLKTDRKFAVSSLNLSAPFSITWKNWSISGSFNAVKPFNQPSILGNEWIFYLTTGLGYTLSW